ASSTPLRTRPSVGSAKTGNVTASRPWMSAAARSADAPVTTSGRAPIDRAADAMSPETPAPNRMRAAVANSKSCIGRNEAVEFVAAARPGHHRRHGVPPFGVMRGLLVLHRVILRTIDLQQSELRGVIGLLDHIETRDSRLLHAVRGVFDRSLAKGI